MQPRLWLRSYRDSLKDAQSRVLRSTSFRQGDLSSSCNRQLEKKAPRTLPKPQGIFLPAQAPLPGASPHAPKERHAVSPQVRGPGPPGLPGLAAVGPPLLRICGRKRLGPEHKKRSYSEPDKMNEIGLWDAEGAAPYRRGGGEARLRRRRRFRRAGSKRCLVWSPGRNQRGRPAEDVRAGRQPSR